MSNSQQCEIPKGFRPPRTKEELEFWMYEPGVMWIPGERFGFDGWVLYHPMMDDMIKREQRTKHGVPA